MSTHPRQFAALGIALAAAGCAKGAPPTGPAVESAATTAATSIKTKRDCGHAACGPDFFVDTAGPGECVAGAVCSVTIKLVATGEFHINREYPYRFKGDEGADLQFLGSDPSGKNVFSKWAGDWNATDEKTGVMTVKFTPSASAKAVSGVFKLSVCSAQNCLLEQRQVSATFAPR